MDLKAQTIGIIAVVLGVILLATLLIPIVSDARNGTETVYNKDSGNGYCSGPVTIVYDGAGNFAVDGVTLTVTSDSNIILIGPNVYIDGRGFKYYHNASQDRYPTGHDGDIPWSFALTSDGAFTFVYEYGEAVTTIYGNTNAALTFHRNDNGGEYILNSPGEYYVNANSAVVGISTNGFISLSYVYYFGIPREAVTMDYYSSTAASTLPGQFELAGTDRDGVYTIAGTYGTSGATMRILIPNAYQQPAQLEGTVYDMMDIIPLIVACGLAVAAASYIRRS